MASLKEVDEWHLKSDFKRELETLKKLHEQEPQNVEVLWRLARALYGRVATLEHRNAARRPLIVEGQRYAAEAVRLAPRHFDALKYAAVLTGSLCEVSGTGERIKLGHTFKSYLDQAIALNPKDHGLLHMRGRLHYTVANLSWFERRLAATFFSQPPTATLDDALRDFLEVERLRPGLWPENLLFLARCYAGKNENKTAAHYLKLALKIEPEDAADQEVLDECKKLLNEELGGWNETDVPPTTRGGLRANEDADFDYTQVEWELYELALSGWKKVWSVRADRFGGIRGGLFVRPTGVYWQRFSHTCTPRKEVTCNGDDTAGFQLLEKLPLATEPEILNEGEPRTTAHGSGDLCAPPDFRLFLEDPEDKLRVCA
ncbi:hypothetical protein M3Y99_01503300 [Aphelenchoides fujianensis]|nr:hypothetical protein M3Y99_01503300 [Aphelenchoides fujianensis]